MKQIFSSLLLALLLFLSTATQASAGPLTERIAQFPNWESKPLLKAAKGDLIYPEWITGTWEATSTLVEMIAPLAPKIVTPGFETNRKYINIPVTFMVRFQPALTSSNSEKSRFIQSEIVADRAFNGLNIAEAYLGKEAVLNVKVDPNSPNRQITFLRGDRQLISTVTARQSETENTRFVATEVSQQVFQTGPRIYLNEVETTTSYTPPQPPDSKISAQQITAIYLSPQDPDYFAAGNKPVALYYYTLELVPQPF
ncbi:hypothetical protein NG798_01885 [Ancylothrix sp. C2]|uniref:DUF6816 family protein n=1 Tax=Ancylothrix sp. D3o TaxID=2953691 RepID=UPI0021BAE3E9|nr:hypothetical protein [Ancylothrix sp. D3o]MCT7948532.1 hypothetical protein [Ancylothrix sp. D3o]